MRVSSFIIAADAPGIVVLSRIEHIKSRPNLIIMSRPRVNQLLSQFPNKLHGLVANRYRGPTRLRLLSSKRLNQFLISRVSRASRRSGVFRRRRHQLIPSQF